MSMFVFFFFKQKTAYEMRISDWSSDVCSSDLRKRDRRHPRRPVGGDDQPRARRHVGDARDLPRRYRGAQGRARSARLQGAAGRQYAADQPLMARAPRDRPASQIALPLDWSAGGAHDGPLLVGTSNADARSEAHPSELQALMRNPHT